MAPLVHVMNVSDRSRRTIAAIAFATISLASGCSSASSIGDASPAAAADVGPSETKLITTVSTVSPAPSLPTLHDLLAQDRFVALRVALERSGLVNVILELDDFVLFAPTGAAFASSGADIGIEYPTLMNDPRLLEAILRYHVVADPAANPTWRTLNGAAVDVDGAEADTMTTVDGIDVLDRITVEHGTVLVVPQFLFPEAEPLVAATEVPAADS